MNIKFKWDRCIAKFINAVLWIKSAGHSYLIDTLSEGAYIGNYVYIASFLIGFTIVNILDFLIDILKVSFYLRLFSKKICEITFGG